MKKYKLISLVKIELSNFYIFCFLSEIFCLLSIKLLNLLQFIVFFLRVSFSTQASLKRQRFGDLQLCSRVFESTDLSIDFTRQPFDQIFSTRGMEQEDRVLFFTDKTFYLHYLEGNLALHYTRLRATRAIIDYVLIKCKNKKTFSYCCDDFS